MSTFHIPFLLCVCIGGNQVEKFNQEIQGHSGPQPHQW